MKDEEILKIIEDTMDSDTLRYLKESLIDKYADRGIHETWGVRANDTYNTVKNIYKSIILNKNKKMETYEPIKVFTKQITINYFDAEMLLARIKYIEEWIRKYDGDASGDVVLSIHSEAKKLFKL